MPWGRARGGCRGSAVGNDDERGAEMVEFAFVVVLLIALLYGIISYGLILSAQSTVTKAAADGARAGIVASSTAQGHRRRPGRQRPQLDGQGAVLPTACQPRP